jgi:hypothetical protein
MKILYITNKGPHMNTVEKYYIYIYIYEETKEGRQINDKNTVTENKIYGIIVRFNPTQMSPQTTSSYNTLLDCTLIADCDVIHPLRSVPP